MHITLKLFAMLDHLLPPGSVDHTAELDVPPDTTARHIIEKFRIPPPLAHLVMIDGIHLLPKEVESRLLREGETIYIFPPIAGG
jgi:molybdopterin converting factor small subunit